MLTGLFMYKDVFTPHKDKERKDDFLVVHFD